ncbi:hypothetical protein ACWCQL_31255 [Streptomyces sp. NPDC002073]|uniref:hypothetical protein n=1 Tax=Streptomyces sp. NBC_00239 TaxID=2903640 RepID=UPI002E2C1BCC|nr:hypothetical protein [Streptomyces sp. NBC_00239]
MRAKSLARGAMVAATAAGVLLSGTGAAWAGASAPDVEVTGVGVPIGGGSVQLGVPYASTGTMRANTTANEILGKSHRMCILEEEGTSYDIHHCSITFVFSSSESQISVDILLSLPHPGSGAEPKSSTGAVTGGSLVYAGHSGNANYTPLKNEDTGAYVPNAYVVSFGG